MLVSLIGFQDFIWFFVKIVGQPVQCHVLQADCLAVRFLLLLFFVWFFFLSEQQTILIQLFSKGMEKKTPNSTYRYSEYSLYGGKFSFGHLFFFRVHANRSVKACILLPSV